VVWLKVIVTVVVGPGLLDQSATAGKLITGSSRIGATVSSAGGLNGQFIILFQEQRADETVDRSSHNVADYPRGDRHGRCGSRHWRRHLKAVVHPEFGTQLRSDPGRSRCGVQVRVR
jgi:hypothetical protein